MKSLILTIAVFVLYGCSTTKNAASTPIKQTFNFDYKTPSIAKSGSANILISLVRPRYASEFQYGSSELFASFRQFMGKDIEELLIDKGFRLKGPYDSFDDMVFEDRKDADLSIEIEIVPEFSAIQGNWRQHQAITFNAAYQPPIYYSYKGTASLIGKINIIGYEPLSREKIWVKSVPIPPITNIDLSTHGKRLSAANLNNDFYNDPNVYNNLGQALLSQYAATFKKIDVQLDPREFESLKEGADQGIEGQKGILARIPPFGILIASDYSILY